MSFSCTPELAKVTSNIKVIGGSGQKISYKIFKKLNIVMDTEFVSDFFTLIDSLAFWRNTKKISLN